MLTVVVVVFRSPSMHTMSPTAVSSSSCWAPELVDWVSTWLQLMSSSSTTLTGTHRLICRPWLVLQQNFQLLNCLVKFPLHAKNNCCCSVIPGSSSQDWSAEAGACLPLHHRKHGGGTHRRESWDETTSGLHCHSAGLVHCEDVKRPHTGVSLTFCASVKYIFFYAVLSQDVWLIQAPTN